MVKKYSTEEIKNLIRLEAAKQGVPVEVALAVAQQESGFNNLAQSKPNTDGSVDRGVMQLNSRYHKLKNWQDPIENIAYGIKHLKGLIAGAKGDIRKALSNYNAGAGATGKARQQGDAYAQKVMALMNKGDNGKVTGAAAPVPNTAVNEANTIAENMANLYEGQISDSERLLRQYFLGKGYDDTYFKKIKDEMQQKVDDTRKKLEKIETSASPEKIAEITKGLDDAKAKYDENMNLAIETAKAGVPLDKINKYVDMFKAATNENIKRMEELNPYTQLAQKAPVNLDDYARAVNRAQQTNAMIRANNIAMGGQAQPVDFGNEALQLAQARQAAEMARQTGLTPEQFLQGQIMNYNTAGSALNNQQQVLAQLVTMAANGDVNAQNQLISLYGQRGAAELTAATQRQAAINQADASALARAQFQAQNEQALLGRETSLYPQAVQGDIAMQSGTQGQTGAMLRQGMQGGNTAANSYLNYEAMLQKAANEGAQKDPNLEAYLSIQKPMLSAAAMSQNVNALPEAMRNYQQGLVNLNYGDYAIPMPQANYTQFTPYGTSTFQDKQRQ